MVRPAELKILRYHGNPGRAQQSCWLIRKKDLDDSGKLMEMPWYYVSDTCLIMTWTPTWASGVRSIEHYRKRLARTLEAFQRRVSKISWYVTNCVSRILMFSFDTLLCADHHGTCKNLWKPCARPQPIAPWHWNWCNPELCGSASQPASVAHQGQCTTIAWDLSKWIATPLHKVVYAGPTGWRPTCRMSTSNLNVSRHPVNY